MCSVYGCPSEPNVELFSFPQDPDMIQKWIEATGGWLDGEENLETAKVCSLHFDEQAYMVKIDTVNNDTCYTNVLKPNAVPSLVLPTQFIFDSSKLLTTESLNDLVVISVEGHDDVNFTIEDNEVVGLQPSTSNTATTDYIDITDGTATDNKEIKKKQENPCPYKLKKIQEENTELTKKIKALETSLVHSKLFIDHSQKDFQHLEQQYQKTLKDIEATKSSLKNSTTPLPNSRRSKKMSLQEGKNLLTKVFSDNQIKILCGKKKIYWSTDDMAVGYTIRYLSNRRFYGYLTKSLNIPLPAVSSIKRWTTTKKSKKNDKARNLNEDEDGIAESE